MAAGTASAAPIVDWDYTVSAAFVPAETTFNGAGPGSGNGCELNSSASITWGACPAGPVGVGRSGISISNTPQAGTLVTNGPAQGANTYNHSNNVVSSAFATLNGATIEATLGLRIKDSGDPYVYTTATYRILFHETPNVGGTCVVDSPPGNPCSDIWVLDGSVNHTVTIQNNDYTFSFFAAPALAPLPDAACAAVGAASGCIGFTTLEGQANMINFLLSVTAPLPPQVTAIPTLSEWGVLLLTPLLAWAGLRGQPARREQSPRRMR